MPNVRSGRSRRYVTPKYCRATCTSQACGASAGAHGRARDGPRRHFCGAAYDELSQVRRLALPRCSPSTVSFLPCVQLPVRCPLSIPPAQSATADMPPAGGQSGPPTFAFAMT